MIGEPVFRFESVGSTNDRALEYAGDSSLHGAVFHTLLQTAGRGQYERRWQAPAGSSLMMSLLLFPPVSLRRPVVFTALAAVCVADYIFETTGLSPQIKWPNDILIQGKKVCGILIETRVSIRPEEPQELAVVCGMGLNLNQHPEDFRMMELPEATSLLMGTGREFDADEARSQVCRRFHEIYELTLKTGLTELEERWRWRLGLDGKTVNVELMGGQGFVGRVQQISFQEITIIDAVGSLRVFQPEEVRHLRPLANA
jgi:BirA family transcriptional regulator, biotin operon repressor / biotin---[acetyl-CoA-carboxylase] ligase